MTLEDGEGKAKPTIEEAQVDAKGEQDHNAGSEEEGSEEDDDDSMLEIIG